MKPLLLAAFVTIVAFALVPPLRGAELPAQAPVPEPSPLAQAPRPDEGVGKEGEAGALDRPPTVPATEIACRTRLRALGAAFTDAEPLADASGCALAHPVLIRSLSADVAIEPPVTVNCAVAETAALFLRDVVSPLALKTYGAPVAELRQASGYVCRPRNGSSKLSEHAFGNALDISAFVLADGRVLTVEATSDRARRDFLRAVRGAACGPFKTVLGPGSDADHATHLHLDLAQRRNGGTYCQ